MKAEKRRGGRRPGKTQLRIFWGEPHSMIQKNLNQELLVVYTILL
jgi:hypothetical protein